MPLIAAGQVTEPSVSVPIGVAHHARGDRRAAAARAEPHGLRSSAHGLRVCPPTALQPEIEWVERMFAHSLRLVLPRITAPAARSRATSGASRLVTLLASARLPAVVGSGPALSILSLISTGWPASGPRRLPASTAPRLGHRGRIERDDRADLRVDPRQSARARPDVAPAAGGSGCAIAADPARDHQADRRVYAYAPPSVLSAAPAKRRACPGPCRSSRSRG